MTQVSPQAVALPLYCECCGRDLNPQRIAWLELNSYTGRWSDPDRETVPDHESQGLFPHGTACAKKRLRAQAVAP